MKKLFLSAALAIFAVAAIAQTKTNAKSDVSVEAKTNTNKNKDKGTEVSGTAKSQTDVEFRQDDANRDGKLSAEERAARKEAKKEEVRSRKADRTDDGIMNGSASENNIHGKTVSELATGTTLEGREKGAAISSVAKANSNGELNRDEKSYDGDMTPEEKTARKEARKEEAKSRKADRSDDGLLNGSADKNVHGKATSGTAVGTSLRGKAKGVEVSTGARAKARVGTGLDVSVGKNPRRGQ
ncbi:MAG: hypothetical protein V4708_18925 [Bacteroidota bacterium]